MVKERKIILVSSCLIGKACAYDGKSRASEEIIKFCKDVHVIDICPEVAGGLGCPRSRNEIRGGTGNDVLSGDAGVFDESGSDNTIFFLSGAEKTLNLCREHNIKNAIMKSKSPSCGNNFIHNGEFNGTLIPGSGVVVSLLKKNGIKVFNEKEIGKTAISG